MENNLQNELAGSNKSAKNNWIIILMLLLASCGGYYVFDQKLENERIQTELKLANEEMQRKNLKVELEKKKMELDYQLETLSQRRSSLRSDYDVQLDKLDQAKEWQFLRSEQERESEVSGINASLRNLEDNLEYLDESILKVKTQRNQIVSQIGNIY